jgi:hypothetical protein
MPRGDQLSRQWRLLQMIDRPQGVTVDDAARELACTIRTIWRDLDALQKAGFPLFTERAADANRGVWRVTEDFKRALPQATDPQPPTGGAERMPAWATITTSGSRLWLVTPAISEPNADSIWPLTRKDQREGRHSRLYRDGSA